MQQAFLRNVRGKMQKHGFVPGNRYAFTFFLFIGRKALQTVMRNSATKEMGVPENGMFLGFGEYANRIGDFVTGVLS